MSSHHARDTSAWPWLGAGVALGAGVGAQLAVRFPLELPSLGDATSRWMLSRSSGLVAFALLWLSMLAGLGISTKEAKSWPGARLAYEIHQHASLLGLGFATLHALALLGNAHTTDSLLVLLLPTGIDGDPAIALGQATLWLMALVGGSFFVKRRLGHASWRLVHFASFLVFVASLVHGVTAGSDTAVGWVRAAYWVAGGSTLLGISYRVLRAQLSRARGARADNA